jgi:hypothetical protein
MAVRLCYDLFRSDLLRPHGLGALARSTIACFVLISGAASILWPVLLGMRRRGLFVFSAALIWLPLYYLLMSWAAWRAVLDLLKDPYHWAKTEHGLARSSRRGDKSKETPDAA